VLSTKPAEAGPASYDWAFASGIHCIKFSVSRSRQSFRHRGATGRLRGASNLAEKVFSFPKLCSCKVNYIELRLTMKYLLRAISTPLSDVSDDICRCSKSFHYSRLVLYFKASNTTSRSQAPRNAFPRPTARFDAEARFPGVVHGCGATNEPGVRNCGELQEPAALSSERSVRPFIQLVYLQLKRSLSTCRSDAIMPN
jgi:hypothetical protein